MISMKRSMKKLIVTVIIALLLAGCSTKGKENQGYESSTFYCYDETGAAQVIGQIGGNETTSEMSVESFYVDAVADALTADLMKELDCTKEEATSLLIEGGLQIFTCMDPNLQALAEAACEEQSNVGERSASGQLLQSAIILLDNTTGKVLALSGGGLEQPSPNAPNPATQMLRQPGSAFVPLSVYAPALELGYLTPDSVEKDQPNKDGWPLNPYGRYQGDITIREALRISSNGIAVEVMSKYLTPEVSAQFIQDRFSVNLVIDRTEGGASYTDVSLAALALGGLTDGVSPMEMAAAFSVFPRQGNYIEPTFYTEVLDREGNVLLTKDTDFKRVLKEITASDMNEMLRDVVKNGVGSTANFEGQDIAGMPGRSLAQRDVWFIGYTPYYTAAVWSGYGSMEQVPTLNNPSAVLWRKVMQEAHRELS